MLLAAGGAEAAEMHGGVEGGVVVQAAVALDGAGLEAAVPGAGPGGRDAVVIGGIDEGDAGAAAVAGTEGVVRASGHAGSV
jgi:hypothetical protein